MGRHTMKFSKVIMGRHTMKFKLLHEARQPPSTYNQKMSFLAHFIELRKGVEILQYYTVQ